jgi:FtsZ-interacting cell division protein YlmF
MAMRIMLWLVFLGMGLSLATAPWVGAMRDSRPFWAEKSAFIEGEELFVVGVASKARSVEEGRRQAFEQGKIELMNYAQVTSLEAHGLVIETQMTYEEENADGSVTVFRLLRVPARKLIETQSRVQAQTRAQEQSLDQARRELAAIQESALRKQQDLETRGKELEVVVNSISRLQVTLGEKALRLEAQQKQVEALLQQLASQAQRSGIEKVGSQGNLKYETGTLIQKLSQAEAQLDAREEELGAVTKRARARLAQEQEAFRKTCTHLVLGMTKEEVVDVMGSPTEKIEVNESSPRRFSEGKDLWTYKKKTYSVWLEFHSLQKVLVKIEHTNSYGASAHGCP